MARGPGAPVRAAWRAAAAVCFDVDSTVSPDEGIDVLAREAGVEQQVAALTRQAMGGAVTFQEALRSRLELIQPSPRLIAACLRAHPPRLTAGIASLVAALQRRAVPVFLVSGGFEPFVLPLAAMLGIAAERVFANRFVFSAAGQFTGFDPQRPTARSGGKAAVLQGLKHAHAYQPLVMIGDGVTDLEARPPADLFIGFGGVAVRERVQAEADWFVTDFGELERGLA
jgi:phosphoserine phosphatase